MNIAWTGKQDFIHPTQQKSIDSKIAHLSKLLDAEGKGEKQAHGILNQHKNQHRAEVTLNFLDHHLVGEHIDPDQFTAINMALEKLEKQIVKVRDKRRDIKKGPREGWDKGAAANTIIAAEPGPAGIFCRLYVKRQAENLPANSRRNEADEFGRGAGGDRAK